MEQKLIENERLQAKENAIKDFNNSGLAMVYKSFNFMAPEQYNESFREKEMEFQNKVEKCMESIHDYNNDYLEMVYEPNVILEVSRKVFETMIKQNSKNIASINNTISRLAQYRNMEPQAMKELKALAIEAKRLVPTDNEMDPTVKDTSILRKRYVEQLFDETQKKLIENFRKKNQEMVVKALKVYEKLNETIKADVGTQTTDIGTIRKLKAEIEMLEDSKRAVTRSLRAEITNLKTKHHDRVKKLETDIRTKRDKIRESTKKLLDATIEVEASRENMKQHASTVRKMKDKRNALERKVEFLNQLNHGLYSCIHDLYELVLGIAENLKNYFPIPDPAEFLERLKTVKDDPDKNGVMTDRKTAKKGKRGILKKKGSKLTSGVFKSRNTLDSFDFDDSEAGKTPEKGKSGLPVLPLENHEKRVVINDLGMIDLSIAVDSMKKAFEAMINHNYIREGNNINFNLFGISEEKMVKIHVYERFSADQGVMLEPILGTSKSSKNQYKKMSNLEIRKFQRELRAKEKTLIQLEHKLADREKSIHREKTRLASRNISGNRSIYPSRASSRNIEVNSKISSRGVTRNNYDRSQTVKSRPWGMGGRGGAGLMINSNRINLGDGTPSMFGGGSLLFPNNSIEKELSMLIPDRYLHKKRPEASEDIRGFSTPAIGRNNGMSYATKEILRKATFEMERKHDPSRLTQYGLFCKILEYLSFLDIEKDQLNRLFRMIEFVFFGLDKAPNNAFKTKGEEYRSKILQKVKQMKARKKKNGRAKQPSSFKEYLEKSSEYQLMAEDEAAAHNESNFSSLVYNKKHMVSGVTTTLRTSNNSSNIVSEVRPKKNSSSVAELPFSPTIGDSNRDLFKSVPPSQPTFEDPFKHNRKVNKQTLNAYLEIKAPKKKKLGLVEFVISEKIGDTSKLKNMLSMTQRVDYIMKGFRDKIMGDEAAQKYLGKTTTRSSNRGPQNMYLRTGSERVNTRSSRRFISFDQPIFQVGPQKVVNKDLGGDKQIYGGENALNGKEVDLKHGLKEPQNKNSMEVSKLRINPNLAKHHKITSVPEIIKSKLYEEFNPLDKKNANFDKFAEKIMMAFQPGQDPIKNGLRNTVTTLPLPTHGIPKLPVFRNPQNSAFTSPRKDLNTLVVTSSGKFQVKFKQLVVRELEKFVGVHQRNHDNICPHLMKFYQRLASLFKNLNAGQGRDGDWFKMKKIDLKAIDFSTLVKKRKSSKNKKRSHRRKDAGDQTYRGSGGRGLFSEFMKTGAGFGSMGAFG